MTTMTIAEINNIDIIDFLAAQNHHPSKITGQNYWYHSMLPDRNDATPSFKVNRKLNRWVDFGSGEGSTLIDLCILLYDWTIRETVINLSQPFSGIQFVSRPGNYHHLPDPPKIKILETGPIQAAYLIHYLWERRIPLPVAQKYCAEVQYTFGQTAYYAIGFQADAGGYELRNKYHKYSSAPKSPTLITNASQDVVVFEGFFDMLTFVSLLNCPDHQLPDLAVLNSTSFFNTLLPVINNYRNKHLFLDNDPTGDKLTNIALDLKTGYLDHRPLYKGYNDLNHWACNIGKAVAIPCMDSLPANASRDP